MNLKNIKERQPEQQLNSDSAADNKHFQPACPKPIVSSRLSFYKQPFRKSKYAGRVSDANGNFVFQFERQYDEKGDHVSGSIELEDKVLASLNSDELKIIPELKLLLRDAIEIKNHGKHFILIRGWGNLTGIGAHNFPTEKAAKIQDDFAAWVIYKLTGEVVTSNGC